MTGPLGPMDDDGVVDLLRAAGHGDRDPSTADVTRAMGAGRKIRRRRQVVRRAGSGLGVAVVLAVGFATVSALDGDGRSTVTAAGDPSTAPQPGGKGVPAAALSNEEQRLANLQLLAGKLGPDFRVNPEGSEDWDSKTDKAFTHPIVEVIPGSPTAKRVPAGYTLTGGGGVPVSATSDGAFVNDTDLDSICKPMVEKGARISACEPVTAAGGRTVQVQDYRNEFGKMLSSTGKPRDFASTTAYFQRVDGSIVRADVTIAAKPDATVTAATHDRAESLLDGFRDALVSFAADPQVGPAPGPATGKAASENPGQTTTYERNQAYLQEALGSPSFTLYEGMVSLEPFRGRYNDLPSKYFSGTAALEFLTQAQFDAACGERAGFAGCTPKTLPKGTEVFTNRWADRNSATDELRGESSAYYVRPDGSIVVATISLTATRVTTANRDEQVSGTLAWFDFFQNGLIAAATDPRMKAPGVDSPTPTKCSDLIAPPRDTEIDHVTNPETGISELYFTVDGKNQHYVIDYVNDPTCDADPGFKRIVEDERATSER